MGATFGRVFLTFTLFGRPLDADLAALLVWRFVLQGHACVHRQLSKAVPGGVAVYTATAPFSVGTLPACSEVNEGFARGLSRVRLVSSVPPPQCCVVSNLQPGRQG